MVPIFSLPPEWLWCETWCGPASRPAAKTIDLCNNPLTKEPKLHSARRIIAEWPDLNREAEEFTALVGAVQVRGWMDGVERVGRSVGGGVGCVSGREGARGEQAEFCFAASTPLARACSHLNHRLSSLTLPATRCPCCCCSAAR